MSKESSRQAGKIRIVDQTLREGMQFRGLMFSLEQRIHILDFQEQLGVDVCQAGYPSAHPREAEMINQVAEHKKNRGYRIRTAALGRAISEDVEIMMDTQVDDIHLHLHVKNASNARDMADLFKDLTHVIFTVRERRPDAQISLAMLDMGKTRPDLLDACAQFLCQDLGIDILSLPDTSGVMAPNQVETVIKKTHKQNPDTALSIHCHNDLGMASANTVMGILAGASVMEVSALGLGERNGIGELYTTARMLIDQNIEMNLNLNRMELFREYYGYVDAIVREQTGQGLIHYQTPAFGAGVQTHVAGTHVGKNFGTASEEKFYLNILCGRGLVRKYLAKENLVPEKELAREDVDRITQEIKAQSIDMGRRLKKEEVAAIAGKILPGSSGTPPLKK